MSRFERPAIPDVPVSTLVDLLALRAADPGNRVALTFLQDGEDVSAQLTYAELDLQARAIGARLQELGLGGERVLMLYPSGPDFVAAFFGCLYAGVVAVPAYPPRSDRNLGRLLAIVRDAGAAAVLAPGELVDRLHGGAAARYFPGVTWLATDRVDGIEATAWHRPDLRGDDLAFLQYTSGSTGDPKGVMLSHANLLHNSWLLANAMGHTDRPVFVSWLPLFHDMGLIAKLIQSVYWNAECVFMPPTAFLQEPIRWLRALSDHGGTISGAPNFAYELCVRRVPPELREGLDLSRWQVAFNAAEPVHAATMDAFAAEFAPYRFRREAFYPCYGLAESTVFVSGGTPGAGPTVHHVDAPSLESHEVRFVDPAAPNARPAVGCGHAFHDQRIEVVDPATGTPLGPDAVGEVWVSGPSVAAGYWQRPEQTADTFGNRLAGESAGRWLRTGDLGFLTVDGELCITGRSKDLIILRGRNLYPQDLERTVEETHAVFRPGCSAAFTVDGAAGDELVVVSEVRTSDVDLSSLGAAVAAALADEHDVALDALVLVPARTIAKTSSGKIARTANRLRYLDGELDAVGVWRRSEPRTVSATPAAPVPTGADQRDLVDRIRSVVAERLGIDITAIAPSEPFSAYGIDSVTAVTLSGDLQRLLSRRLAPTLLYDHPTVEALARFLAAPANAAPGPMPTHPERGSADDEPIAVIGLGCRFPGANDPDEFWDLLRSGTDAITEVPADRWGSESLFDGALASPGSVNTRWGGFLDGITDFDPEFFGIAPGEAAGMDPQQRVLLEVAWEALDNAGIAPRSVAGTATGVWVGVSNSDHSRLLSGHPDALDAHHGTGTALSVVANRLSYLLDARGPSMAVDTACSSALVAVHQATAALRRGECELALAGGVNIILTPHLTSVFSRARMMAADGHCKAFDASADGYVRSEGCGVVVLKRLSRALANGDRVLAVIRGSAVNQDGRTNGLTAPNGQAQRAVITAALADAGVSPHEVGYVETHGTGTPLGDPIEYAALADVLRPGREPGEPCFIGSVKTNIGHLEPAAGIAGLIKVVLALHHGEIPAQLHFTTLNPHIDPTDSPLEVAREHRDWPRGARARVAGVSSFGFGGTNAHVVLAGAPADPPAHPEPTGAPRGRYLYPLSAHTEKALRELAARHAHHLVCSDEPLSDLCATVSTGRDEHPYRLAVTGADREELRAALAGFAAGEPPSERCAAGRAASGVLTAFLFTGQGSQRPSMAAELYRNEPVFRETYDRCADTLTPHLEHDLRDVVFGERSGLLDQTAYAQPALFVTEFALAELWRSWGVRPTHLLGHSIGEYVAACLAGVFDLDDALALVATRARLIQALPPGGAMAAVRASEAEVADVIAPYEEALGIAAVNGPRDVVVSGSATVLDGLLGQWRDAGVPAVRMRVSHAFHSPLMEPALAEFRRAVSAIRMRPPALPVVSNVTGQVAGEDMATADYWVRQLRQPVRFADSIAALTEAGCTAFLEVGPDAVLTAVAARAIPESSGAVVRSASLRRGRSDQHALLDALARLWVAGVPVDWAAVEDPFPVRRRALPTYPFQRRRLWRPDTLDPAARHDTAARATRPGGANPLLGGRLTRLAGRPALHVWHRELARDQVALLDDHRIQGQVVAPGVSYIEMALAALREIRPGVTVTVEDVEYWSVLAVPEDRPRSVQVTLDGTTANVFAFTVHSRAAGDGSGDDWTLHATGRLMVAEPAGGHHRPVGRVAG